MTPDAFTWSAILSNSTLAVYLFTGRHSARLRAIGWTLSLATEPIWFVYGYVSGGLFWMFEAVIYSAVAVWNLWTLSRTHGPAQLPSEQARAAR